MKEEQYTIDDVSKLWSEIESEDKHLSATSMSIILRWVESIWLDPRVVIRHGIKSNKVVPLGVAMMVEMWSMRTGESRRGDDKMPADPVPILLKELREEILTVEESGEPAYSLLCTMALGCLAELPDGFKCLKRFAKSLTRKGSVKKSRHVAQGAKQQSAGKLGRNQRKVSDFCLSLGKLFFGDEKLPVENVKVRTFPLLAGPTGAGKTHMVRELAVELDCHYIRMDYGSWMPQGSKHDPATLDQLADLVLKHERILLHIDELDKLRGEFNGAWDISVMNEIWKVLDRPIDLSSLATCQSYEEGERAFEKLFADRIWIVGSGTWQDIFGNPVKSIGFSGREGAGEEDAETIERIHSRKLVPPELLARFNSRVQILRYPEVDEVVELLANGGLLLEQSARDKLVERLPRAGFRAVEDVLTDISIRMMEERHQKPQDLPTDEPESEPVPLTALAAAGDGLEILEEGQSYRIEADELPGKMIMKVKRITDRTLEVDWLVRRKGTSWKGDTVCRYEPIPWMRAWDSFARKWDLPQLRVIEESRFCLWWVEPIDIFDEAELEKAESEIPSVGNRLLGDILEEALLEIRSKELVEEQKLVRFAINQMLLLGGVARRTSSADYKGPSLFELLGQGNGEVDRGIIFLFQILGREDIGPDFDRVACLREWEEILVKSVVKHLGSPDFLCEFKQTRSDRSNGVDHPKAS